MLPGTNYPAWYQPGYVLHSYMGSGGTVCLPGAKLLFFVIPLKTGRWPKANSPWCHDSNVPLFFVNRSTLAKLEFLVKSYSFLQKKWNFCEQYMNCFFAPRRVFCYFVRGGIGRMRASWKDLIVWSLLVFERQFCPNFECPFPPTNPLFCTLGHKFNLIFCS